MTSTHRRFRLPAAARRLRLSAASGAVLGVVALALVAVILGGAVSAYRAFKTIDSLSEQLTDARHQIDGLRDDNDALSRQNTRILEQNRVLVKYLRRHGLEVPEVALPPSSSSDNRGGASSPPKAPAPSGASSPKPKPHPPSPTPRPAPTPSPTEDPNILDQVCDLVPLLCP